MILHESNPFRKWARRLVAPLRSGALILLYHRVDTLPFDPQLLAVSPSHFNEHLAIINKIAAPISLPDLAKALRDGKLPRRGLAVTFDDGYADNLLNALPIAAKHAVPGTVFVASAYFQGGREFWWDEVERIVFHSATLPAKFSLNVRDIPLEWSTASHEMDGKFDPENDSRWDVLQPEGSSARRKLYRLLMKHLLPLNRDERSTLLEQLRLWARDNGLPRSSHRPLSAPELRRVEQSGLFNVGAHTHTHPMLSALSLEDQKHEIVQNKIKLEELLNHPISTFSYPYGSRNDYTADTVQLVRDCGFSCACSNFPGPVRLRSDPYQLPRYVVRDWDGDQFSRHFHEWLHG